MCSFVAVTEGQTRIYRGTLGNKHIEMRLEVVGNKVTGAYFYDQFRQEIKLEGTYDGKGQLELIEGAGKRKTGKFVCQAVPEKTELNECEWSRIDGTGKAFVVLGEQGIQFKNGITVVPKFINDRKLNVVVSYPQLNASPSTPAIDSLNRLLETLVQKAIKDFALNGVAGSLFDTNYDVLLATDDIVSIEMQQYSEGGAHPDSYLWTINYSLKTNKQLSLGDVFRSGDEYKQGIAEFVVKDINRRADEIERDEARRSNRQPAKREEPMMTLEQLPELDAWALTPKGLAVYFNFPHAIAVFDKTVVPYSVLAHYLSPTGIVPQAHIEMLY